VTGRFCPVLLLDLLKKEAKRRRKGSWGSENTKEGLRTQVDSTALHYVTL